MHVSCIQAGTLLARLGRPEAMNCIAGLEQYSHSYEEAGEQAADMKRTYHTARYGDLDFNHMLPVVSRVDSLDASHAMMVDDHHPLASNGHHTSQVVANFIPPSIHPIDFLFLQPNSHPVADSFSQSVYGS